MRAVRDQEASCHAAMRDDVACVWHRIRGESGGSCQKPKKRSEQEEKRRDGGTQWETGNGGWPPEKQCGKGHSPHIQPLTS